MPLLAHRRYYAIYRWIFHFALRGLGFNNWRTLSKSGETWVVSKVLKKLTQGDSPTFLDVGANAGEYSQLLIDNFPKATVHSFEPHPLTFVTLNQSVGSRATCHQLALGSENGTFQLYDRGGNDGGIRASLVKDALESVQQKPLTAYSVLVSTIDDFVKEQGISSIDFMKIDTEGFEMDVLKGARNTLSQGKIGAIQFEFNVLHIARREFLADFEVALPAYRLFRILPDGLIPLETLPPEEKEIFAFQNILALPKSKSIPWK